MMESGDGKAFHSIGMEKVHLKDHS